MMVDEIQPAFFYFHEITSFIKKKKKKKELGHIWVKPLDHVKPSQKYTVLQFKAMTYAVRR